MATTSRIPLILPRSQASGSALLLGLCLSFFLAPQAVATPLFSAKETQNCGGCHTPGRSERPLLERRCTLDCQGCHIDPNGAGPRNQWGTYYSQDQLPAFTFFKPADPLTDTSVFDVHFDGRYIQRQHNQNTRTFPMHSELSLRLRPLVKYLHLTYQLNLLGRVPDKRIVASKAKRQHYQEKYALMVDNLPLNMYVRASRGSPLYGIRRPNHNSWIRERIGLGQFTLTDAVTIGGTPTVPFMHFSQMQGSPLDAPEDRQQGNSYHAGMRGVSYGWNIHTSGWSTASRKAAIAMTAVGGGANLFDFVLMTERNWRRVTPIAVPLQDLVAFESRSIHVHPASTISETSLTYTGIRGLNAGSVWETMASQPSLGITQKSRRLSFYLDLHPIPFLQMELWRRFETGARSLMDTLVLVHLYGDF